MSGPRRRGLVLGSPRELGTVGLVSGLCGAYAAVLIMTSVFLGTASEESGEAVAALLGVVASVFIGIAVYVAAIVIVNAVDTVLAGRLSQIALLRLLGARGRSLRSAVVRGATLTGAVGAVAGNAVGTVAADVFRIVLVARGTMPDIGYPLASPLLCLPVATMAPACAAAGWIGSRRILRVSPAAALSDSWVAPALPRRTSVARVVLAGLMVGGGAALLALAMLTAEGGTEAGFVVAFAGSVTAGTGLLVGARFVIPGLVRAVSRLLGTSPVARVAGRNAVLDPLRTTRSTVGLVVGVTLVTTFASGLRALQRSVGSWDLSAAEEEQMHQILSTTTAIMVAIVVISAVISAVGFVSTMSLTVIQRRREIGLLRSLGLTRQQVRRMITLEAAALSGTAVAFGIALGVVFGSIGAQSLVGGMTDGFVWGLPWSILAVIAVAGLLLVLASAGRPPTERSGSAQSRPSVCRDGTRYGRTVDLALAPRGRLVGPDAARRGRRAPRGGAAVRRRARPRRRRRPAAESGSLVPVPEVLDVRAGRLVTSYVEGVRGDLLLPTLDDAGLATLGAGFGAIAATLAGTPTPQQGCSSTRS